MGELFDDPALNKPGEPTVKEEPKPETPYAGKTPEELTALLLEKDKGLSERDAELKNVLPRVEQLTKQIMDQPPIPGQPAPRADEVPDPRVDPEGFYDHMHKKNVAPLAKEAFERFADYERDKAKSSFKDFPRFSEEIDELVGQMSLELRARKGSYEMAYRIVKGKHLEELEKELENKGAAFAEPATPANRPDPVKEEPLSDMQQAMAKNLGLSQEEYRAWAKVTSPPERKAN